MIKLPKTELTVMKYLWEKCDNQKEILSKQVSRKIAEENNWTLGTVGKLFARLVEKGFLEISKENKKLAYKILVDEKDYVQFETEYFLKTIHNNSIPSLMSCINDIADEENLEDIKKWIESK